MRLCVFVLMCVRGPVPMRLRVFVLMCLRKPAPVRLRVSVLMYAFGFPLRPLFLFVVSMSFACGVFL